MNAALPVSALLVPPIRVEDRETKKKKPSECWLP